MEKEELHKGRKMKNMQSNLKQKGLKEKSKGITLIALVITIIVLLILAGVSIATLTGENGILTKANEAKDKTQIADVIERVQTDILGLETNNGQKISKEELRKILEKYFEKVPNPLPDDLTTLKLKSKQEYGGQEIQVSKIYNGGLIVTAESITADEYGAYVNYGIDINGDGDTTKDWKIFYVEDYKGEGEGAQTQPTTGKRIFLISADYVGNNCDALTGTNGAKEKSSLQQATGTDTDTNLDKDCCYYWSGSNIPTYGCTLPNEGNTACAFPKLFEFSNYDIKKHASTSDSSTQYNNSKCAASLLCTGNWSKFVTTGGEYAIGGPTLEMWVDSWNEKEKGANNFSKLYAVPKSVDNDYGYYVGTNEGATSTNTSLSKVGEYGTDSKEGTGYYDTLYFPHRTTAAGDLDKDNNNEYESAYWLASPSAVSFASMMRVGCNGIVYDQGYDYDSCGLRPVVCLKSNVYLEKVKNEDGIVYYNIK